MNQTQHEYQNFDEATVEIKAMSFSLQKLCLFCAGLACLFELKAALSVVGAQLSELLARDKKFHSLH